MDLMIWGFKTLQKIEDLKLETVPVPTLRQIIRKNYIENSALLGSNHTASKKPLDLFKPPKMT